jgi:hypothetical protein
MTQSATDGTRLSRRPRQHSGLSYSPIAIGASGTRGLGEADLGLVIDGLDRDHLTLHSSDRRIADKAHIRGETDKPEYDGAEDQRPVGLPHPDRLSLPQRCRHLESSARRVPPAWAVMRAGRAVQQSGDDRVSARVALSLGADWARRQPNSELIPAATNMMTTTRSRGRQASTPGSDWSGAARVPQRSTSKADRTYGRSTPLQPRACWFGGLSDQTEFGVRASDAAIPRVQITCPKWRSCARRGDGIRYPPWSRSASGVTVGATALPPHLPLRVRPRQGSITCRQRTYPGASHTGLETRGPGGP